MNDQRPLARVILTTVDMIRACREEIARLDKAGFVPIVGRPETRGIPSLSGNLIPLLIEVAARLGAASDKSEPPTEE